MAQTKIYDICSSCILGGTEVCSLCRLPPTVAPGPEFHLKGNFHQMKKEKQLSPLAVASAVRKYLATLPNEQTPGVRRAALIELWTFRTVLGKRRYERIVYDTCEEIVHELGIRPRLNFRVSSGSKSVRG